MRSAPTSRKTIQATYPNADLLHPPIAVGAVAGRDLVKNADLGLR